MKNIVRDLGEGECPYEAICVVGGDGTLNQLIKELIQCQKAHPDVPVVILPVGTANDLARTMGMSLDWSKLEEDLNRKRVRSVDVLYVNGKPFVTIGGMGIGAHLLYEFNQMRSKSSLWKFARDLFKDQIYTALTVKTVLTSSRPIHRLFLRADDQSEYVTTGAIFVCNQRNLGSDLNLVPDSSRIDVSQTDGKFEVLVLTKSSKAALLKALVDLKSKKTPDGAIILQTSRLSLSDQDGRKIMFFGDGEMLEEAENLEIELIPNQLALLVGSNASHYESEDDVVNESEGDRVGA